MIWFFTLSLSVVILVLTHQKAGEYAALLPRLNPPQDVEYLTFGYKESVADALWLRLIQNFDYCGVPLKVESPRGGQNDELAVTAGVPSRPLRMEDQVAKGMDPLDALLATDQKPPSCHLGWAYHMLDGITKLTPDFGIVYRMGGVVLSVVVDDREGAARIFERGAARLPRDWSLAYRASYHFLYEVRDLKKAAEYLRLAGENGAPEWVQNLAGKIYLKSGQLDMARTVLLDLLSKVKDDESLRKKVLSRLRAVEEELQKTSQMGN